MTFDYGATIVGQTTFPLFMSYFMANGVGVSPISKGQK